MHKPQLGPCHETCKPKHLAAKQRMKHSELYRAELALKRVGAKQFQVHEPLLASGPQQPITKAGTLTFRWPMPSKCPSWPTCCRTK